jgi:hypothetical protein
MTLLTCSICRKPVQPTPFGWTRGNNAQPVNDGRCCDDCNWTVVLPARRLAQKKGRHQ